MKIVYFEKLTLVDYPRHLATTVFTPGCVFRCPYCHSPELADPTHEDFAINAPDKTADFFAFLATRRGKLDGVCITGGEPTLHAGLIAFMRRIKDMGFHVKLDTNGNFPERIAKILDAAVVDYWAMDIKHAPEKYSNACGVDVDVAKIKESAALIMARA